jgi:hypothetical protein
LHFAGAFVVAVAVVDAIAVVDDIGPRRNTRRSWLLECKCRKSKGSGEKQEKGWSSHRSNIFVWIGLDSWYLSSFVLFGRAVLKAAFVL